MEASVVLCNFRLALRSPKSEAELRDAIGLRLGSVVLSNSRVGNLNFGLTVRSPKSEAELRDVFGLRFGGMSGPL